MEQSFEHWHYPKVIQRYFHDRERSQETMKDVAATFKQRHSALGKTAPRANWIAQESGLPWMPLDIPFPRAEMLSEARRMKSHFVSHRGDEKQLGYAGKGWRALTLHGLSPSATSDAVAYDRGKGVRSEKDRAKGEEEAVYHWTEAAKLCPVTTAFLKKEMPHGTYLRVRFLMLEPGAFLLPHRDREQHELSEMYLALNHPKGCYFKFEKFGYVPQKAGFATILDVANVHSVINASEEDRYHVVIIGNHRQSRAWQSKIEDSYVKYSRGRIY